MVLVLHKSLAEREMTHWTGRSLACFSHSNPRITKYADESRWNKKIFYWLNLPAHKYQKATTQKSLDEFTFAHFNSAVPLINMWKIFLPRARLIMSLICFIAILLFLS